MRWLLFLSRLAFICGICFLLSVSMLISDWTEQQVIASTIGTIGHLMGLVVVPLVNIAYLVTVLSKKKLVQYVPRWLVAANIFFLLILIFYIFYLNDPYYHQ